jgi:hypothetical protein
VFSGIIVRAVGITPDEAQGVAAILQQYHAAKTSGQFDRAIFLKNVKSILEKNPALSVSQEPGTMIVDLTEMPSDDMLDALGVLLLMNPGQEVVWVHQKGVLDHKALKEKILAIPQVRIIEVPRNVAGRIQAEALIANSRKGKVATILVEDPSMRAILLSKGLMGNVLYAEKNKALASLQGFAAMRLSQHSAKQITPQNWDSISAILLKEFGQGSFSLNKGGYLVLDNNALAALERVLSDLIAIKATSVSA